LRDILLDYKNILERIFDPVAYANRLDRMISMLERPGRQRKLHPGDVRSKFTSMEKVHQIMSQLPAREVFWRTLSSCAKNNPAVMTSLLTLMAVYLHLGPYSRYVIAATERRITALQAPGPVPAVAAE